MSGCRFTSCLVWIAFLITASAARVSAHSGPPYPIVTNKLVGPYQVSLWADPDTTDDRSAAGRFWIMLDPPHPGATAIVDARVRLSVRPLDRPGTPESALAAPVAQDASRQFVALVLDHEGPFAVTLTIDGPLGHADVGTSVQATYDLRPARALLLLYLLPFVLVGWLWTKQLLRRRRRSQAYKA